MTVIRGTRALLNVFRGQKYDLPDRDNIIVPETDIIHDLGFYINSIIIIIIR